MFPAASRETHIAGLRDRKNIGFAWSRAYGRRVADRDRYFVVIMAMHYDGISRRKIDFENFDDVILHHEMVMRLLVHRNDGGLLRGQRQKPERGKASQ